MICSLFGLLALGVQFVRGALSPTTPRGVAADFRAH
jgi:hypothetical protein